MGTTDTAGITAIIAATITATMGIGTTTDVTMAGITGTTAAITDITAAAARLSSSSVRVDDNKRRHRWGAPFRAIRVARPHCNM